MAEADRRKWDARYRELGAGRREASDILEELADLLPGRGRALDVAGGSGRNALWLARRGLDVTLADISAVALAIALEDAGRSGQVVHPCRIDLEVEPLPSGPWDLILCVDFLWRPHFATIPGALARGGLLVVAHPTIANLERHARPGPEHLLGVGELPRLVRGLEILRQDEGWRENGRHEARLAARRHVEGPG